MGVQLRPSLAGLGRERRSAFPLAERGGGQEVPVTGNTAPAAMEWLDPVCDICCVGSTWQTLAVYVPQRRTVSLAGEMESLGRRDAGGQGGWLGHPLSVCPPTSGHTGSGGRG